MSDYLEGTLNDVERRSMEVHFHACAACNELLAGIWEVMLIVDIPLGADLTHRQPFILAPKR